MEEILKFRFLRFGLLTLLFSGSILFSGCYRSEPEDHLHRVPATNNQALIEDSGRSMVSVPHQF